MRPFLLPLFTSVFLAACLSTCAAQPAAPDARARGDVREMEIVARAVRPQTKSIAYDLPHGSGSLYVGPRTWIFGGGEQIPFADLRQGQRLHVWYVPRGAQAVIVQVLPPLLAGPPPSPDGTGP
jgi:hypothetical protein